ncbi:microfibril-associated glycoprotein 4-like [Mytilus californianus]|uniref:microfibril-associated glycoprotein 4-like n=1 Tax=Mytilus californianus TaxID=6549 RepID=UPI00224778DB|nr:microfibril-associated glycoprotein 4-like [Mytilus californianus]
MASPQIELESNEQPRRAEDQHRIVHEVNISRPQWKTIFIVTLIVFIVSTSVLTVFYFALFVKKTKGIELRPRDCGEIYLKRGNGIYTIFHNSSSNSGYTVYCDFETDNGNWTVFQRRINGTTNFFRGWEEYENGFGNLKAEFWLGNKKINELTSNGLHELRVDLTDFEGNTGYAKYSKFFVGNVSTLYKLDADGNSGDLGDSLESNNGMRFSTKDRDNDVYRGNCANINNAAWWYSHCTWVNLNGRYLQGGKIDVKGITWYKWKSSYYSMKSSVMMLRKVYPPG